MESHRARPHRARPSRRRPLLITVLVSAVVVGATAGGAAYVRGRAHAAAGAVSSSATPSASRPAAASEEASVTPAADPAVDRDALLSTAVEKALKAVPLQDGAKASVAVLDLDSGESAGYGDGTFDTASIVKVDILATLLLQAQDAGRSLTAQEKTYATAMIENSDNTSASALWDAIGQADGLDTANKRFGLTGTAGGTGPLWGLTRTTAADQLTLLKQVFGYGDSLLSSASRSYLQGLMGNIETDQDWGVSAAAADGSAGSGWALKNGWLARSTTGLWDVNSVGRVTCADGDHYLVAVLSDGHTTQAKGIAVVEAAAKAAVTAFADDE